MLHVCQASKAYETYGAFEAYEAYESYAGGVSIETDRSAEKLYLSIS